MYAKQDRSDSCDPAFFDRPVGQEEAEGRVTNFQVGGYSSMFRLEEEHRMVKEAYVLQRS